MILEYRKIELFGKLLFEKAVIKPPFKKTNPLSEEACFLYIMEGEYNSVSEKEQLRIKAREAVLLKCGNYLSQMFPPKDAEQYQAVAVHFYPDILRKIFDKIPVFLKENLPAPESGMGKINSEIIIHKYIDSILFYFDNPELVNEEILILKLKEIILLLNQTKNAPAIRAILSNLFNPTTYSFREVIDAHLFSNITINELAQLTNRSLSSFKREFTRMYQEAPATYIREKKLEKAAELMVSTELRTTEIAFVCGFSDVAHLSKTFKQKFGIAPSIYKLNQIAKSLG